MNTRNAVNDTLGPDEATDPNIEQPKGAPFDESLPSVANAAEASNLAAAAAASLNDALQAAASDAQAQGMNTRNMRVEHAQLGEVSLVEVMNFLKAKFPAFVLFVRMGDEDFKIQNPDGTWSWKDGMDPSGVGLPPGELPPKREWGAFFEGPDTPYDPKARKVILKWVDANSVREIGRRS